jgi:lysophospholipase L1-like esterase
VLNRGISGQTTWQILDRTPAAIRELAGLAGAKWCVILAGTNDSKSDGKLPHTDWEILYRQILHWPRRYEIPITLCTLPRIGWPDMPCFSEKSMAWIATANERIRAMRIELDNKPSPVRLCDLEDIGDPYLIDGVHLTEAGYRMLAERIAAVLEV